MARRFVFCITLSTLLAACGEPSRPRGEVGSAAPEYHALSLEGDTITLAQLQGRPVLVNVWATWCPPCRKEMPELQALHDELAPRGLQVVGISIDADGADPLVRDFLADYGITYRILRDPGDRASSAFRTQGVPTTLLIGADGTILWRHLGPFQADDAALREALNRAIGTRGA